MSEFHASATAAGLRLQRDEAREQAPHRELAIVDLEMMALGGGWQE